MLLGPETDDLAEVYAVPSSPWLRLNFVSTVDGGAQGPDGLSGSINNAADKVVYDLVRGLADVLLVGAGTARAEGYRPWGRPTCVVSGSGRVPETLLDGAPGQVLLATCAAAPGLAQARAVLGDEHVLVRGQETVDLAAVVTELGQVGSGSVLCEGGPSLARDLLALGLVDDLCLTTTPRLVAGDGSRITKGLAVDVPLRLQSLVEQDHTLLARWSVG